MILVVGKGPENDYFLEIMEDGVCVGKALVENVDDTDEGLAVDYTIYEDNGVDKGAFEDCLSDFIREAIAVTERED
jgi:hypothetical protein